MKDLLDQYERVASISQAQLDFLMGVTEFYRARTDTKMTIAAERLAVIAADHPAHHRHLVGGRA